MTKSGRSATLHGMIVATTDKNLREAIGNLHYSRCGFVPTMGALHEGHLALIRRAREVASPVVVSVFVNPTQFGPGEDYERYPRTLQADVQAAEKAGADVVFAPEVTTVYPEREEQAPPPLPAVATTPGLEDRHRPGHFAGVCQVVARLFDLVQPHCAVLGEKDYQQLLVIKAMTAEHPDRWPGLEIIGFPTVRDPDGLAMSSRNRYLTPQQRQRALAIPQALERAQAATTPAEAETAMAAALAEGDLQVDYAVVRDAATLEEPAHGPQRALIAARVDNVRLIDNSPVHPSVSTGNRP